MQENRVMTFNIVLLPVILFPSKLILSSVAISVSLSGKTEKLLLARLMLVKCSISPTASGSLVRTLPCSSSSARYFKTRIRKEVDCSSVRAWRHSVDICEVNSMWAQKCITTQTVDEKDVFYYPLPLSWVKVENKLLEMAFISLSAKLMAQIFSETLLRTLNTPSGKEISLHFDRSAKKKNIIMILYGIL